MARICKIEIENFRSIRRLSWCPTAGINCLIGPGDSGKSSLLDAIDLCLGARRSASFTDADFYRLNVSEPIKIQITIGDLYDSLKDVETYGIFLRNFSSETGIIDDEPDRGGETVITIQLTVESDLEPTWSLISTRAADLTLSRSLSWEHRARLSPTRIGNLADFHLGWRKGSVLNKLAIAEADTSAALVKAARDARIAFGDTAGDQLSDALAVAEETATQLGIPIGTGLKAMLDAHSVSFSGGTISLHDNDGIPLRGLGVGSTRLLIAGLQRKVTEQATIVLIDELEYGLEPHRIVRFIGSLGAKESCPPLQAFMTTHSPVALKELSGAQLFVLRKQRHDHQIIQTGNGDALQGTLRSFPEAFLAHSVIVCEGATEVGFIRGLDQYRVGCGIPSITAQGASTVDADGACKAYEPSEAFSCLGYRTAILRDDDNQPDRERETAFIAAGGKVFTWGEGRSLEDELFLSLSNAAALQLLDRAVDLHGDHIVNEHIKSATEGHSSLCQIKAEGILSAESRKTLGRAARTKRNGWFKKITWMEDAARDIVGPDLPNSKDDFQARISELFDWFGDAGR